MERINLITQFSELGIERELRLDSKYNYFRKELIPRIYPPNKFVRLKEFSGSGTNIVFTSRGTFGKVHFNKDDVNIHAIVEFQIDDKKLDKDFLYQYSFTNLYQQQMQYLKWGSTVGGINKNEVEKILFPNIAIEKQGEVLEKITPYLDKITSINKKVESLQDIIDDIFVEHGTKDYKFVDSQEEHFVLKSQRIGDNLFLRLGAQYYSFFEVHHGFLFDESSTYNQIPLKQIIKKYKATILKKGTLDQSYILLDLEQLEAKTGKILDESNEVEKIGSDKVVFGVSNIVISKLRPYLSYVLINDKDKNYIGTTELVPFKLVNKNVIPDYLKYCLLSNEYIKKSELIMYGKEHPRIHIKDLLSIKIPLPELKIQEKIVSEIQQREERGNRYKKEIKKLREEIDNLIYQSSS